MELTRTNYSSGAPMEEKVGYSRMVRVGPFVSVGGTTSVQPDGSVYGEGDPYAQASYIFSKIQALLARAGAGMNEVIRVRVYVTDMKNGAEINRAYVEFFQTVKPLYTMVEIAGLFRPAQLLEVELDAVVGSCPENKQKGEGKA